MTTSKGGRRNEFFGTRVTCSFELTQAQSNYLTRRAKICKVSRSRIVRTLVDLAMEADFNSLFEEPDPLD